MGRSAPHAVSASERAWSSIRRCRRAALASGGDTRVRDLTVPRRAAPQMPPGLEAGDLTILVAGIILHSLDRWQAKRTRTSGKIHTRRVRKRVETHLTSSCTI